MTNPEPRNAPTTQPLLARASRMANSLPRPFPTVGREVSSPSRRTARPSPPTVSPKDFRPRPWRNLPEPMEAFVVVYAHAEDLCTACRQAQGARENGDKANQCVFVGTLERYKAGRVGKKRYWRLDCYPSKILSDVPYKNKKCNQMPILQSTRRGELWSGLPDRYFSYSSLFNEARSQARNLLPPANI